ncbi:Zn-ribbon domain-containing protein [Salinarchaeum chitinilyticum]
MPHQCTGCGHVFPDGSKEMLSGCPDCGGNKFQFQPSGASGDDTAGASASDVDGTAADPQPPDEPPEPPEPPSPGGSVAETVASATQRVKNAVGSGNDGVSASGGTAAGADDHEWPAVGCEDGTDASADVAEDTAQASARSGTVSPDELPDRPTPDDPGFPDEPPEAPAAEASTTPSAGDGTVEEPAGDDGAASTGSAPFTGSGDREEQGEETPDLSELRAELNDQFESIKIVERGQYELNLMELYDREEYIISLMEDGRYAIEVPETWRGES